MITIHYYTLSDTIIFTTRYSTASCFCIFVFLQKIKHYVMYYSVAICLLRLYLVPSSFLQPAKHSTLGILQGDSPNSLGHILVVFCKENCIILLKQLENLVYFSWRTIAATGRNTDRQTDRQTRTYTGNSFYHTGVRSD